VIRRNVLVCGQSLLLPLVAASLEQNPELCVTHATTWQEASRLLAEHTPDVLIFDLTDAGGIKVLPLLLRNPQLMLIGLDTEQNQAVLVSGQEAHSLTLDRIRDIVHGEIAHGL
jgi:DNA-binding NarL/FixJ family response regulator